MVAFSVDAIRLRRGQAPRPRNILYARPGGDGSDPSTEAGAVATREALFRLLPSDADNEEWVLDVSTLEETTGASVPVPPFRNSAPFTLSFLVDGFSQWFTRPGLLIRALPQHVQDLTLQVETVGTTHGLKSYTVAETLTPGALVDTFLIGSALAEYGVIHANTANEVFVTSTGGFTAPVAAYDVGATFTDGDVADFFLGGWFDNSSVANLHFSGIRFRCANALASFETVSGANMSFDLCDFEGVNFRGSGSQMTVDACVFRGKGFNVEGSAVTLRNSYIHDCDWRAHGGSKSNNFWRANVFRNVDLGIGHGGNAEAYADWAIENCLIDQAPGVGVLYNGGAPCRVVDTRIEGAAGSAIRAQHPGFLRVFDVQGTVNGPYGIELHDGVTVLTGAGTGVTGATNDLLVGGAGGLAYSAVPTDDAGEAAGTRQLVVIR